MISLIKAEFKKYLIEIRTYYPDHLVSMIITLIIFGVFALNNQSSQASFYIGFIYWYLTSSLITESSTIISMEKQLGTLEQLLIKPVRFDVLVTIKTLVWYLVNTLKVLLTLLFLTLCLKLNLSFSPVLFLIFTLASLGIFGLTLVLVALTLKYTKVASFESIISYSLLFLTGAVVPLEKLPTAIQFLGNNLPLTIAVKLSRTFIDSGIFVWIDFYHLIIQSLAYLILGYWFFNYIYQKSKQAGLERSY